MKVDGEEGRKKEDREGGRRRIYRERNREKGEGNKGWVELAEREREREGYREGEGRRQRDREQPEAIANDAIVSGLAIVPSVLYETPIPSCDRGATVYITGRPNKTNHWAMTMRPNRYIPAPLLKRRICYGWKTLDTRVNGESMMRVTEKR